jgi:intein/homing endonuclease
MMEKVEEVSISENVVLANPSVLMFDGTTKNLKDVNKGDLLMGADNKPRKVEETRLSQQQMFEIIPSRGRSFILNASNKLTLISAYPWITFVIDHGNPRYKVVYYEKLKSKSKQFIFEHEANDFFEKLKLETFDVFVKDYIMEYTGMRRYGYLYHIGITFQHKEVPIDPYLIGYWLGDGTSAYAEITTADPEIVEYFTNALSNIDCLLGNSCKEKTHIKYRITGKSKKCLRGGNKFLTALQDLNLINNKHIPDIYKMNSREVQLELLSGLIDSDGHVQRSNNIEISQKNKQLADDIEYLCFSLGFMVTMKKEQKGCFYKGEMRMGTYYRLKIFGEGLQQIKARLPRKQCSQRIMNKRASCLSFIIKPIGIQTSYNIVTKHDKRYLLSDFTVVAGSKRNTLKRKADTLTM